jgi:hypothetical protein
MPHSSFELTTIVPALGFIDRYLQEEEHVGQSGSLPNEIRNNSSESTWGPGGMGMSAWMTGIGK